MRKKTGWRGYESREATAREIWGAVTAAEGSREQSRRKEQEGGN